MRLQQLVVATAVALACGSVFATPANAANPSVDKSIRAFLVKHPQASRTSPYQVAWPDGVVLTWADPRTGHVPVAVADRPDLRAPDSGTAGSRPATTSDVNGCPSGYTVTDKFCFYENGNFGGRMIQFSTQGTKYFADYGFQDLTSSWVNTTGTSTDVYEYNYFLYWSEAPHTKAAYVAADDNDRADLFHHN